METIASVQAALEKDKGLITGRNVAAEFANEARRIKTEIQTSVEAGHCMVNGKWFLRHYAPAQQQGKSEQDCRDDWTAAAQKAGGLPEVFDEKHQVHTRLRDAADDERVRLRFVLYLPFPEQLVDGPRHQGGPSLDLLEEFRVAGAIWRTCRTQS